MTWDEDDFDQIDIDSPITGEYFFEEDTFNDEGE